MDHSQRSLKNQGLHYAFGYRYLLDTNLIIIESSDSLAKLFSVCLFCGVVDALDIQGTTFFHSGSIVVYGRNSLNQHLTLQRLFQSLPLSVANLLPSMQHWDRPFQAL